MASASRAPWQSRGKKSPLTAPSRTRLAKDLTPKSSRPGKLVIGPRDSVSPRSSRSSFGKFTVRPSRQAPLSQPVDHSNPVPRLRRSGPPDRDGRSTTDPRKNVKYETLMGKVANDERRRLERLEQSNSATHLQRRHDSPKRNKAVMSFKPMDSPSKDPHRRTSPFSRELAPHDQSVAGPSLRSREHPRPHKTRDERTPPDSQSSREWRDRNPSVPDSQVSQKRPLKPKISNPLAEEFDLSARSDTSDDLPTHFTAPPLMEGLMTSVKDVLGRDARPTSIQALAMKHILPLPSVASSTGSLGTVGWSRFLLASETGSGKSIAYLLPVLQHLKQSELDQNPDSHPPLPSRLPLNPRALILAPTHELSRQLSTFAKSLVHNIKLRILCASRANVKSSSKDVVTASKMSDEFPSSADISEGAEFEVRKDGRSRPVDVVVGTPMKLLELVHGRGWNREEVRAEDTWDVDDKGRNFKIGRATKGEPEMGLAGVEWVVVDEADVLFDPDFQESTQRLLADISRARGRPIKEPVSAATKSDSAHEPLDYPFHLLLSTATIPSALASYLDTYHPSLTRLASPKLHHLPSSLQTEYVGWTGGNRNADIEKRIRRVWTEDTMRSAKNRSLSKVLVFCNKSSRVEELGSYLHEKGIANAALTSTSAARKRGSNHHLAGFLKGSGEQSKTVPEPSLEQVKTEPHVMITTSLLSRGLDFSPSIRHVFIVDEPRNMIDFLHRAGRSGRAGQSGKVVVFGKMKGRGSTSTKVVRKKVGALLLN